MTETKFIVSSQSFYRALQKYEWNHWGDEAVIQFAGHKMTFVDSEISLDVETRGDGQYEMSWQTVKRLKKVMKALADQPVSFVISDFKIEFIDRPMI